MFEPHVSPFVVRCGEYLVATWTLMLGRSAQMRTRYMPDDASSRIIFQSTIIAFVSFAHMFGMLPQVNGQTVFVTEELPTVDAVRFLTTVPTVGG